MFSIGEKKKTSLKNLFLIGCLFLTVFAALFYIANFDFSFRKTDASTVQASFAGAIDDETKKRIGSSEVSFPDYGKWAVVQNFSGSPESDADGDGLANYLEYIHLTDPQKTDTDKDGFSDLQEIKNGYDPDASGESRPWVELHIKKIGASVPVILSKSAEEKDLQDDLKRGVIRYPKTAAPGQNGNTVISGHSSNYVWAGGEYNHIFKSLNDLESGDIVEMSVFQKNGRIITYKYEIKKKYTTAPDDPTIFEETVGPSLTLSTCWPLGTNFRRLIVKAELLEE